MANALEFIEKDTYDFEKEEDKKRLEQKFYKEVAPRMVEVFGNELLAKVRS